MQRKKKQNFGTKQEPIMDNDLDNDTTAPDCIDVDNDTHESNAEILKKDERPKSRQTKDPSNDKVQSFVQTSVKSYFTAYADNQYKKDHVVPLQQGSRVRTKPLDIKEGVWEKTWAEQPLTVAEINLKVVREAKRLSAKKKEKR